MALYVDADLCSYSMAATSQFGGEVQLTGGHHGNEIRNVTCLET